mmetsp:Transcript_9405/g.14370  ORF Transcript_9405/g.14370 Transcript_9405/m.14370 type:complete len:130 (+) Transcript_9405:319-708(+)
MSANTLANMEKLRRKTIMQRNNMMGNLDEFYNSVDDRVQNIINSTDEGKKARYMLEVIESIYDESKEETNHNIKKIHKDINKWAKDNVYPMNPEYTFIKRDRAITEEARRKEKETLLDEFPDFDAETEA